MLCVVQGLGKCIGWPTADAERFLTGKAWVRAVKDLTRPNGIERLLPGERLGTLGEC